MEKANSSSCPQTPPIVQTLRSELIATAVTFLKDPQVQAAPLSKRLAFLESKGLTQQEIDLALSRSSGGERGIID